MTITQDRLKELLNYDPDSGVFTWRVNRRGSAKMGDVAGCVRYKNNKPDYVAIRVLGKKYQAHRLAWFYAYGEFPAEIDHADNNTTNNRLLNLRLATRSENCCNRSSRSDNSTGYKGVYAHQGKYRARVQKNGVLYSKTGFDTPELAYRWYCEMARKTHGEFARV